MISDVAAGPDWWQASDGKWYPPDRRTTGTAWAAASPTEAGAPMAVAVAATGRTGATPPPIIPPALPAPAAPATVPRPGRSVWSDEGIRSPDEMYAGRRPQPARRRRRSWRGPVDARGVFVSLASAVVLVATFLPWYTVTPPPGPSGRALSALTGPLTILDHGFGGWRYAIPAIALAAAVGGVIDALIRAGQRGALLSFVTLRILVLAQLGTVIAAVVARTPEGLGFEPGSGISFLVTVRWPVWGALAAAVVAVGGSLASSGRP